MLWTPLKQASSRRSISLPPVAFNGYSNPDPSTLDLYSYNSGASTTFNYKSLKCWYSNVDSLSNKLDELKSRISTNKPDIVALSEIYPKSGDFNLNLNITGYTTICNAHQPNKRGNCIFVHSRLSGIHLSAIPFSESVWCFIPLDSGDGLLLGVIYCSPNSDSLTFEHLCSLLTSAN